LTTCPVRAADEPTTKDLLNEIQQLQAKVQQLETAQHDLDTRAIDATIDSVLNDAQRRSNLVDTTGITSGFSMQKGFFISNEDQSFYLHPRLTFQFRGVANYLEDGKHGNESDTKTGFEVRRAKFGFDGNFTKDITFRFQWQDSNNGGTPTLEYGWAQFMLLHQLLGGNLAVRAGQYKDIVFKEETTGDEQQLLVERSLLNTVLGGGAVGPLVQGVDFIYGGNDNPLHAQLILEDGANTGNTDFQNIVGGAHINFGVAGRVDYKLWGNWGDADDLTGVWGKSDLLVLGAGADFTQSDNTNAVRYTADAQWQLTKKLALLANFNAAYVEFRNTGGPSTRTDYGAQVEAGYFLTSALQIVGRYSIIKVDDSFKVGNEDKFHEITAGINWFLGPDGSYGNRAKISLDVTYLPNGSPAALGNDFRANPNGKDEWVARAQLQLWL
jgi:hypothetical protein